MFSNRSFYCLYQIISLRYERGVKTGPPPVRFRKGACENCGAMTHNKKVILFIDFKETVLAFNFLSLKGMHRAPPQVGSKMDQ
jgi:hypothetical protein